MKIFNLSKKNILAGAVISVLLLVLTITNYRKYMNLDENGMSLFVAAILLSIAIFPAALFHPDCNEKRYYPWILAFTFFVTPLIICGAVELLNGNFLFAMKNINWLDNYCVILLFLLFIFALSGSVRIPVFIASPFFVAFGIINMYLKEFKGSPLVPMDVGSIATAFTVADGYTYDFGAEISFSCVLTVLLLVFSSHLAMPKGMTKKIKLSLRGICLAIVITVSGLFYGTDIMVNRGYQPDFFNQMRGYKYSGAVLSFIENTRYMRMSTPKDYDPEELSAMIPEDTKAGTGMNPDIIVIMNESFADLKVDGNFNTNKEVMPYIDSMKKNTVKGYLYTPVFGYGTSNTEFEFLTGDPIAFFPSGSIIYQLYVDDHVPGLVTSLNSLGYDTYAYHPYFGANWNREKVYDYLGFDDFISLEDMLTEEEMTNYKKHGSSYLKKHFGNDYMLRIYLSDKQNYKTLMDIYDSRDKKKPFFMFNVTIQNHSPYNRKLPKGFDKVKLTGLKDKYPNTEQYLSIIRNSDKEFGKLIEHFKKVTRPTIILMFGDHQPFVEDTFYEEVMGTPTVTRRFNFPASCSFASN